MWWTVAIRLSIKKIGGDVLRFKDKVVLVTGAGSGIGYATAERIAQEGGKLLLADINGDALRRAGDAIQAAHATEYGTFVFDASDMAGTREMVKTAAAHFGRLDVLCNIAGIAGGWHTHEMPEADYKRMMAINVDGVFASCQEAIPHLIETKGNIVNMASASSKQGQPYTAAYCASKAAVVAITRCLAVEYAGNGVRANAVCPGGVNTNIHHTIQFPKDADAKMMEKLYPLFPIAEPHEIAAAIAYLASDEARYVTGVDFSIDGGQTVS
ncbi:SDR family NAD(P)-dependent oxidoreductase [Pandoraea vervacti]|uniref:SDR family NAD(P)-dependent oxidoreductase n=1 Tax=Pandoraea vervacti TaxID=656178 RepID=UPI001C54E96B|nr:SDR family oxidoreductase [Pandoraea vervacti]